MEGITSYGSAFSPVYSGYYSYGSLRGTGSRGRWWSATAYNRGGYQNALSYSSGSLGTGYDLKYYGDSVRCIRTT